MKLYATVTSERASKGQGGNRSIVIDLIVDPVERETVGRIEMRYGERGEGEHEGYTIYYYPVTATAQERKEWKQEGGRVLLYRKPLPQITEEDFFSIGVAEAERRKGEKQKGLQ